MELVTSFLVNNGRAIRPDLHWKRLGINPPGVWIPPVGQYFPQFLSYTGVTPGPLRWRLRPAPKRREDTVLRLVEDPRDFPQLKGPDLSRQLRARNQAILRGAHDAALTKGKFIREGANCALLFFQDGQWVQAPRSLTVDSVTVTAAVEAGLVPSPARRDIAIETIFRTPAIAASALHGFTNVTGWIVGHKFHPAPRPPVEVKELNRELWRQASAVIAPD